MRKSSRRLHASVAAPPRSAARSHRAQARLRPTRPTRPRSPRPRCLLQRPSSSARPAWAQTSWLPASTRHRRSALAAARPSSHARQGGVDPRDRLARRATETVIAMGNAARRPSRGVRARSRARRLALLLRRPAPLRRQPRPRQAHPAAIVRPAARPFRPRLVLPHPLPHPCLSRRPRQPPALLRRRLLRPPRPHLRLRLRHRPPAHPRPPARPPTSRLPIAPAAENGRRAVVGRRHQPPNPAAVGYPRGQAGSHLLVRLSRRALHAEAQAAASLQPAGRARLIIARPHSLPIPPPARREGRTQPARRRKRAPPWWRSCD